MNWDSFEGQWKNFKGSMRQKWAKLTDDDVEYIGGSKDRFLGRMQERYGYSKEQAQQNFEEWQDAELGSPKTRTSGGY